MWFRDERPQPQLAFLYHFTLILASCSFTVNGPSIESENQALRS